MFAPSSFNILANASSPGHAAAILSGETYMIISASRDCIAHMKKVVALACERASVDNNAVATKL